MPIIKPCMALDIGEVRIGIATNPADVRIAQPRGVIANDEKIMESIKKRVDTEQPAVLVIGLPRGMQGQETDQTKYVREFVETLKTTISIPIELQDEALTSVKAEQQLDALGRPYERGDIDALAASFILQDYLDTIVTEVTNE